MTDFFIEEQITFHFEKMPFWFWISNLMMAVPLLNIAVGNWWITVITYMGFIAITLYNHREEHTELNQWQKFWKIFNLFKTGMRFNVIKITTHYPFGMPNSENEYHYSSSINSTTIKDSVIFKDYKHDLDLIEHLQEYDRYILRSYIHIEVVKYSLHDDYLALGLSSPNISKYEQLFTDVDSWNDRGGPMPTDLRNRLEDFPELMSSINEMIADYEIAECSLFFKNEDMKLLYILSN